MYEGLVVRQSYRIFFEHTLCLLVLAALAGLACLPLTFWGHVPLAGSSILFEAPWEAARPPNLAPSADPRAERQALMYYPWYALLNDAAKYGDSLLWNPLEGCGMPFLALWRSRCFSPFSLPFYLMDDPAAAYCVSVLLKLIVAGWCAFMAARKLGFVAPLALFVGVTFEFSGHVYLWLGHPMSDVLPWLPMWLVYAERLILGQARYWPFGAAYVALMAAGGDPESLGAAIAFGLLFILLRLALQGRRPKALRASTAAFVSSVAIGLALAAIQLLPYAEFLREAAATGGDSSRLFLNWTDLPLIFFPHFFGAAGGLSDAHRGIGELRVLRLLHAGIVPAIWIPLWFSLRRYVPEFNRRRTESMLLAALLFSVPAFLGGKYLAGIPFLKWLGPEHFLIGNALAFGFVAAAAAEEWIVLNAEQCKRTIAWLLVLLFVLAVPTFAVVWVDRGLSRPDAPPFLLQAAIAFCWAAMLLGLLTATVFRPSARLIGYGLAAIAFGSLVAAFLPGIPRIERALVFPRTDFIGALSDNRARLCGSERLKRWPVQANLIAQVNCPSGIELERHRAFFEAVQSSPLLLRRTGAPALLLTKEDIQGAYSEIRPMLEIRQVFSSGAILFNDLGSKPRAWMAYDVRPVNRFDPKQLSADAPPLVQGKVPAQFSTSGPEGRVSIGDGERFDRVPLRVENTRAGLLILADTWYPGWKASVDGVETEILLVDGLFRGVPIGEGTHDVLFWYAPYSYRLGRIISAAAAVLTLLGMVYTGIVRFRNRNRSF